MEQIFNLLKSALEPAGVIIALVALLLINSLIFRRIKSVGTNGNVAKNTITFFIVLVGTLIFILSLPIDHSLKGQIISFLAIIISAGIALSSTTVLGNLIAGIMNNSMNRFRNGDLIKVGDFQGRVTKISIFHTEIQLEDSNFMTIPNLYIANTPVKLTRKTNTVISTTVSLGYDVSRLKIEEALKEAALATGLTDPYVYIENLGDFFVVYKIHGFLKDSNKFFSTSSMLNGKVMDILHERKIEIVSPTFMNQRGVDKKIFIPAGVAEEQPVTQEASPEEMIFDEAIKSEKIEKKKDFLKEMEKKHDTLKTQLKEAKDEEETQRLKNQIERLEDLKVKLTASIQEKEEDD
ncbi:MAG: mechanosensitive ion channel family protein [Bacteroidales bacterium]|nr:mechanosensitive ion channel family protein [Bacteroidales bacterium]